MAVTASGLFYPTFRDQWDAGNLGLDLELDTHKTALYDNNITPNFDTNTLQSAAPYTSDEVTGTNWPADGIVLLGTGLAVSPAGTFQWDATDVSEANTDLTNARCAVIYADAALNELIVLIDFTSDFSTVDGTFAITWDTLGIFTIDLTP